MIHTNYSHDANTVKIIRYLNMSFLNPLLHMTPSKNPFNINHAITTNNAKKDKIITKLTGVVNSPCHSVVLLTGKYILIIYNCLFS